MIGFGDVGRVRAVAATAGRIGAPPCRGAAARHGMRRLSTAVAALAAATLLVALPASASASTLQPWWHIDQNVRPTYISSTVKGSEVQEITFVGGDVFELEVEGKLAGAFNFPPIYPLATPAAVQAALEGPEAYGEGNVEVTEGASPTQLIVKTIGEDAGKVVAPIEAIPPENATAKVIAEPSNGEVIVHVTNVGDAAISSSGPSITVADTLPPGLEATSISGTVEGAYLAKPGEVKFGSHGEVTCSVATTTCTYTAEVNPFSTLKLAIAVKKLPGAGEGEENEVTVSGGGASRVSGAHPIVYSEAEVPFGAEGYETTPEEAGGAADTQAGSHPFQLTTSLTFDQTGEGSLQPAQPRNLQLALPAGFVGDATAVPQCKLALFAEILESGKDTCPADTAIGVATTTLVNTRGSAPLIGQDPVFNLTPSAGEPARFGMLVGGVPVVMDATVRSGEDYGVSVDVQNIPQAIAVLSSVVTIWGVPGDPSHDASRGWSCIALESSCATAGRPTEAAFLTMPSACGAQWPFMPTLRLDSWIAPLFGEPVGSGFSEQLDGCNRLQFAPSLSLEPTKDAAASPTGLNVGLHVPQQVSGQPGELAEADVREATVALPSGLQINPAAAAGLEACTESDIGYVGTDNTGRPTFTPESEAEKLGQVAHATGCPRGSKLGTVTIHTPLIEEDLTGAVYQAAQGANPFGSLLALYVIAEAPQDGVRVRLAGEVKVEPGGRLVSRFPQTPQLPFEDFELKFFPGSRAPLATTGCGTYTTTSSIESWAGGAAATPLWQFAIGEGPDGASCSSLGGFAPGFAAGTANNAGGAFSSFTMKLVRNDGEQTLSTVSMTMPEGLAGMLSKVPLCSEAQASVGACPAASKIGHVVIHAGVGSEPIELPEEGKPQDPVYLTGPYDGAPFGLAIVVPAEAGPFNLDEGGHPVVVRAKIEIDPHTAQVSIVSDAMPTELHNIQLDVRSVEVIVDRSEFMFNPTSCEERQVTGTIGSADGVAVKVASRFEAADCATLPFKPTLKALVHHQHSRKTGVYAHFVIKSGAGQANLKSVLVKLPGRLPSRLETLKHSCTEAQFAQSPAGCPASSKVGTATAYTPVLPVPLRGPAIFVSHGGRAYPDLDLVLKGDGVTIVQTGNTHINNKTGVTSSFFKAIPDVPVSRVDVVLPARKYSALGGVGNLCYRTVVEKKRRRVRRHGKSVRIVEKVRHRTRRQIKLPVTLTGQNGAVVKKKTNVAVTGCGKQHKAKGARVHKRNHRHHHK